MVLNMIKYFVIMYLL